MAVKIITRTGSVFEVEAFREDVMREFRREPLGEDHIAAMEAATEFLNQEAA